jgi:hypothetical protein
MEGVKGLGVDIGVLIVVSIDFVGVSVAKTVSWSRTGAAWERMFGLPDGATEKEPFLDEINANYLRLLKKRCSTATAYYGVLP